ncbi:hypothetical protein WMY93_014585 [Mugilogobius chulae]|uniref:RRM domain-containing protein n=1 Tax=Mugilogobius chulae TaxID=88201 RepID=A0AAW0NUX0_9GOBI
MSYHKHAASFARLQMMRNAWSQIPDIDGFIQHRLNNDWKAMKKKHGIKISSFDTDSSSDEDFYEENNAEPIVLVDEKKMQEKAEKKRLKKQRQKERRRLEKQQNTPQDNETKDKTSQACNGDKDNIDLKDMASALESESSDSTSDGSGNEEDEGLDLNSSFVCKAAEIAKRKMEQKQEGKDKKKSPVKEEPKMPEKSLNEENGDVKKDIASFTLKMEDFIKMSAEFATRGNQLAASGDYIKAVKYFTDAIKYNPTEFRLFGNRAFCFEKMHEYEKSLSDAELSLSMNPGWIKGLFRKGRALEGLKRYDEAASAFKEVLKLESSSTEAAQNLMRVQIMQLMEYGFTQEQCSNALLVNGSVEKALEVLLKMSKPVSPPAPAPLQQVVNVNGVSPGLSAKAAAAAAPGLENKPLPVQNLQSQPKVEAPAAPRSDYVVQAPELFPVWVGNLSHSITEDLLGNLFNKVGRVYSIKQLPARRCAFINFTQQHHCHDAIRRYHGFEIMGSKLAVRFPDRIPPGLNISKAAQKSNDMYDESFRYDMYAGRPGYGKPYHHNYRYPYNY